MSVVIHPPPATGGLTGRSAPGWRHELRVVVHRGLLDHRRSVLVWGLTLGALCGFMAAIYPSIQSSIDEMVKSYPSAFKKAFDVASMNTVEGYIHAEMFSLIVPLAIGYFSIRSVLSATAGAEEQGHLDTILALPISRTALMIGSYLVAAAISAAIMVLTGAITFLAGWLAGTRISLGLVMAGAIGVWPLALFFGGVAALAGGALHAARTATGIALGALVAMYAIDLAGRLATGLEPIRWASAFRYYGAPMRDGIDPLSFVGLSAAGMVLVIGGALLFERRDVLC